MANPDSVPEPFLALIEKKAELSGRFTNIKRLGTNGGHGQFSLMFTADDQESKQKVALKFLDPRETDPYRIDCFDREIEVLGMLDNQPGIPRRYSDRQKIIELFQHESGMVLPIPLKFYALELADSDLATVLNSYELDPEDKILQFRSMCKAVQRIHRMQVVHRDIKPSNFLIMPDDSLRLSDFGTARCLVDPKGPMKRYTAPPGDWTYSPLEMVAGLHDLLPELGYSCDMYALGAVLFELFTGTQLNSQLFNWNILTDLNRVSNALLPGDKVSGFHKMISSYSNRFPLPDMRAFGDQVPRSIAHILYRMYSSLAALDYRQRSRDFESTFLQINQCLVVLRNQAAYDRWLARKRAYIQARELKQWRLQKVLTNGATL